MSAIEDSVVASMDAAEIEQRAQELMASGQVFLAHDLCQAGLDRFPEATELQLVKAMALCQTGAAMEAKAIAAPIVADLDFDLQGNTERAMGALQSLVRDGTVAEDRTQAERLLKQLSEALLAVGAPGQKRRDAGVEMLTQLADLYLSIWLATQDRDDLATVTRLFQRCVGLEPSSENAFGAAVSSALIGDMADARERAGEVIAFFEAKSAPEFNDYAMLGVSQLLLEEFDLARSAFESGQALLGGPSEETVPYIRMITDLKARGLVPDAVCTDCLIPPRIAVFTGHELDRPGAETVCLPPSLEGDLRKAINERLDEMDITIGYSLPRCGSDLLFIEALLERDAEVHIILPYNLEDFVSHCVAYAGKTWEKRFRKALRLAESISYATVERFMGHEALNRFANQYLHGLALLRSAFLHTDPYLLAVWDMREGSLPGGAADFIDQWENISNLRIIDLDWLREDAGIEVDHDDDPVADPAASKPVAEREIRTMLFADIVGFSKLEDDAIPDFLDFYNRLFLELKAHAPRAMTINTWGDAFFVVMEDATQMVDFALAMREAVRDARKAFSNGIETLDLRISLHAGPVFGGHDPFRKDQNFYGAHINRAARLEPVTIPGHIYATQQFVALLTVEDAAQRHQHGMTGGEYDDNVACDYVGVVTLAKGFGRQAVYHVRRKH